MLTVRLAILVLVAVPSACGVKPTPSGPEDAGRGGGSGQACARCTEWDIPVTVAGPITDTDITELSGLAASRKNPGVLYAHNDSGDTARFFAMTTSGARLGRFNLPGASAVDWEDMAVGPCPAGSCLFLGDIGDNRTVRTDYGIYRVTEPTLAAGVDVGEQTVAFERFAYQYPAGAKFNAETLLVHPVTGEVFIVTKMTTGVVSTVYRFPQPLNAAATATLEKVAELLVPDTADLPLTGGSFAPCGNALLLRMYNRLVELRLPVGSTDWNALFTVAPFRVAVAVEQQGEAVAYSADGRAYFTASEGTGQKLSRVDCAR
jgi:hypothetical protein